MAKVTIEDISRQTGYSRGTVSRALNDRPDISERTKQRVLEVCRRVNYAPNPAARSLATGRNLAVAVLVDDLHSAFAASFLRGVLARAQAERYAVHVAELGTDPEQQKQAVRATVSDRIDSVLVAASLVGGTAGALHEATEKRPVVACMPIEGTACDVFAPDQVEAGRLVARHLLRNGNRTVLYVDAPELGAAQRLAGFQEVCREHGLDPKAMVIEVPADGPISGQAAQTIGDRLRSVRAVAASDDLLAIAVLSLCWRAGRVPGEDIAVMGQGNTPVSGRIVPALSTIDFCGEEIGRRAMDTALQRLGRTRMDAPQTTYVPPLLVARRSTQALD